MKNQTFKQYDNFGRCITATNDALGMPYIPISDSCTSLEVDVPDSMGVETHEATNRIKNLIGGNVVDFVADRLGYDTGIELCKGLASEQIDAVAVAIYNIEAFGQALIIGDQTGIGKGRQAASIIRYAVEQGFKPVFVTEKANLFSDLYRDMVAIGSGKLKPYIINAREAKTDVKNEEGEVIYQAEEKPRQKKISEAIANGDSIQNHLSEFDYILTTYSQFSIAGVKQAFFSKLASKNIIILDESHNASGASETGNFIQSVVADSAGVLFLSATFAKRPDNMPVYALKTAISEANMTQEELVEAITRGGVSLQEILASQLVKEGQMLRRERSYEGIEVNYLVLTELATKHRKTADTITEIIRDIIHFQSEYLDKQIKEMDKIAAASNKEVETRKGTKGAGVDATPYFSKVFNIINQMLFAIKAESVADRAIERLKQGKKPVIAFYSTMETFLSELDVQQGETVNADFSMVLKRGLDGVMRYTETDVKGNPTYKKFELASLSMEAQAEYYSINNKIKNVSTGISISPIDIVRIKIEQAGYKVAEVTGRSQELQINLKNMSAILMARKKIRTNDAFRMFNNNEVDCLMINQTGSTGASAHAIPTKTIKATNVKQRVMIILQPELDINKEVQKRGRINRTGQILKPIYDYVSSAIPAESRLMMMLQRKLKSLDANTSSNQKQSSDLLSVPDFLNKIGDKVAFEYLLENPKVNKLIGDPLDIAKAKGNNDSDKQASPEKLDGAASKISGRVAVLSTEMQAKFYDEITARYNDQVEYLKQVGEYDLEVETMNLQATVLKKQTVIIGKGGRSEFATDSFLELTEVNILKKPFKKDEIEKLLKDELKGREVNDSQVQLIGEYEDFVASKLLADIKESKDAYAKEIADVPNEKAVKMLASPQAREIKILERTQELEEALAAEIDSLETSTNNRAKFLRSLFNYFYIGRGVNFPVTSYEQGQIVTPAIFIGVTIDKKRNNPYAPSAVKFKFAVADSNKFVQMVASGAQGDKLNSIIGASNTLSNDESIDIFNNWSELIKKSSANRGKRYIITGNILQAFSSYKGKLVSYTTMQGSVRKGILMPDNWTAKDSGKSENTVSAPIKYVSDLILSMQSDTNFTTSIGIRIYKNRSDEFVLFVPGSRGKFGHLFLDADLLQLVDGNNFNRVSDQMKGTVQPQKMIKVIELLQSKFSASVSVHENLIANMNIVTERPGDVHLKLHNKPKKVSARSGTDELELEAMAIELELELLNFTNVAAGVGRIIRHNEKIFKSTDISRSGERPHILPERLIRKNWNLTELDTNEEKTLLEFIENSESGDRWEKGTEILENISA